MIITEHCYVDVRGRAAKGQLSIAQDEMIEGLAKLVHTIHENGVKVFAQISHAGGAAKGDSCGLLPLGASSIPLPKPRAGQSIPKEMTQTDIDKVVRDFTAAAIRAKKAGFDGIELHSAHGYLLNQFFSPLSNKRKDCYNGITIEGRIRFHLEIIASLRDALGSNYPLAIRLGACDYMEGGTLISDSVAAAIEFEKAGIDLLDISGGFCSYQNPDSQEPGYFSECSKAIKNAVSIPVMLTGGIKDIQSAEALLKQQKADMIGVGRPMLKDAQWALTAISNYHKTR